MNDLTEAQDSKKTMNLNKSKQTQSILQRWARAVALAVLTFFGCVWLCFFINPFFDASPIFSSQKENQNQSEGPKPSYFYRQDVHFLFYNNLFNTPKESIQLIKIKTDAPSTFAGSSAVNNLTNNAEKISYWTILVLTCLALLIPRLPGMRLNFNHLRKRNIIYAPPAWLGGVLGWFAGLFYLYYFDTANCLKIISLTVPVVVFLIKNFHFSIQSQGEIRKTEKDSTRDSSEGLTLFKQLDSVYKNHKKIDHAEVSLLFSKIKNWFLSEKPLDDDKLDISGAQAIASKFAEVLFERIDSDNGLRIGVTGSNGSGKSSFITLMLESFYENHKSFEMTPIFCKVNMWGCRSSNAAQEYILESILDSVSSYFDTSSVDHLPQEWRIVIEGYSNSFLKFFHLIWIGRSFEKSIVELSSLLEKLKYHLIVVIEDVDRNKDTNYDPKQIQALLERLKKSRVEGGLDCTIVVAGEESSIDFSRFSEMLISPPPIPIFTIKKLIWATIVTHNPEWQGFRNPESISFSLFYGHENTKNSVGSAALSLNEFSLIDFQNLIQGFRKLKQFERKLDADWKNLNGEIDYFDLFLVTLLRISCPEVYDFIHANHQIILSASEKSNLEGMNKINLSNSLNALQAQYQKLRIDIKDKTHSCDKILVLLFGKSINIAFGIPKELELKWWSQNDRQRIKSNPFPTDYWSRAYMGLVNPNEVLDRKIIYEHESWRSNPSQNKELITLLRNEIVDCKWASLKLDLTKEQILSLAFDILLDRCIIDDRPVCINLGYLAGMTAESCLTYLKQKAMLNFSSDPEAYSKWAISSVLKLTEKNLHAAVAFFYRWVIGEDTQKTFPSNNFEPLKTDLNETLNLGLKEVVNPHQEFIRRIPENDHDTTYGLICIFSSNSADLMHRRADLTNSALNVPKWLSDLLFQAINDPETAKKATIQLIGCLFKFSDGMINPLRILLVEDRIEVILPQSSIQALTIISQTSLSGSVFAEYENTIHEQALNWLSSKA